MEYTIVLGLDRFELITNVNKRIKDGYVPIGGVSAVSTKRGTSDYIAFHQAMIKNK